MSCEYNYKQRQSLLSLGEDFCTDGIYLGGGGVSLFGFLVFGWLDFCLRKKALSKASIPASVSSDSIFYFLSASHLG